VGSIPTRVSKILLDKESKMWYLAHTREYKFISCNSYEQAVNEYYRQYRDDDGSLPWTIEYKV
jgi:hypothetical protein